MSGYLLRTGSAVIGGHGIPEDAACLPNWVRRDLERGGVIGFEPMEHSEGRALPIQWKGTIAKTLNGTIVRMHEIANVGKPILDGIQRPAHSLEPIHHLIRDLQRELAHNEPSHLMVFQHANDEAICVVTPQQ